MKFRWTLQMFCMLVLCFTQIQCQVTEGPGQIGSAMSNPVDIAFPDATTMYVANANQTQEFFRNASMTIFNIANPTLPMQTAFVETPLFNGKMAVNSAVLPNRLFLTNRLSVDNLDFSDPVFDYNTANTGAPVLNQTVGHGDDPFGIDIIPAGPHMGTVMVTHISVGVVNYFDATVMGSPVNFVDLSNSLGPGILSSAIAVSPDGLRAVVTSILQNILVVVDLSPPDDFTVEAILFVKNQSLDMPDFREVVWIDNHTFATANRFFDGVFIIDLDTLVNNGPLIDDTVEEEIVVDASGSTGIIPVPLTPFGDATSVALVGNRLYVGEFNGNWVNVVNLATSQSEKVIFSGGLGPVAVRLEPGGRYLYVANQISSSIGIIDTTNDTLVGTFP